MNTESRAVTKALLLEILAECDQSFSDVLIKRIHPIVKRMVDHAFEEKRNELTVEIAVILGQIMQGRDVTGFDWPVDPSAYTSHMMGKK